MAPLVSVAPKHVNCPEIADRTVNMGLETGLCQVTSNSTHSIQFRSY